METEIKLQLPPESASALQKHPLLAAPAGGPVERSHTDTYFDTRELALWRNGWTLRVRACDGRWVQTVKRSRSPAGGGVERGEWEWPLEDETPDLSLLRGKDFAPLREEIGAATPVLKSLFINQTRRTLWMLDLPNDTQVECALDIGELRAGKRTAPVTELELELKRGEPLELFELALRLQNELPLTMESASKAARGFALLSPKPERHAAKAGPIPLRPKMTMTQAFRCMASNCLSQVQANENGVRHLDVESLHQMRVGLRRLRALLDLFAPLLTVPPGLASDLDWLAAELGPARDWDVLAHHTAPRIAASFDAAQPLVAAALQRAEAHHRQLAQILQEPRYTRCMLGLYAWLLGEPWLQEQHRDIWERKASEEMAPLLDHAMRRLRKRAKGWDEAGAHARHRIRIAAKKARYAIEFFSGLLKAREVRASRRLLTALQEGLGRLNDAAVADRLLDELGAADPGARDSAAFARGYLSAEAGNADAKLDKYVRQAAKLRVR